MGGVGFFSWGGGGGEEDSSGQVLQSRFRTRHEGSNSPIFYVIYYILISGGFVVVYVRPSRTVPNPRYPGPDVLFKLGQFDDPLPHTENSEGPPDPRSTHSDQSCPLSTHLRNELKFDRTPVLSTYSKMTITTIS